jgi:hypothetical protein
MVGYNAGVYGLEENGKGMKTKMSPCHTLIVLLDGSVLERSLSIRIAVICAWSRLQGWQEVKSVVLLEASIISKGCDTKQVPPAVCLLIQT